MSMTNVNMRMTYTGTGSASVYPYTFKVLEDTDLEVWTNIGTGGEQQLIIGTDYTVDGLGRDGGGNVNLTANLANGTTLAILRIIRDPNATPAEPTGLDLTQPMDIKNQGAYQPQVIERSADRQTMMDQSQQDEISRSLKLARSEVGSKLLTTIPLLDDRKGMVLGFDPTDGRPTAFSNVPTSPLVTISGFWQGELPKTPVWGLGGFLDAVSAAAARTALGISGFFSNLIATTPAAYLQTFLQASTAAAARVALGFTGGLKFILDGDIADGTITADKLAFSFKDVAGITRALKVYNTSTHQLSIYADTLKIEEVNAATVTQAADMDVNGTGGLEFTTPGGTTPSTELASHWYSIWVICKADGTAQTALLSASLTSPNMPAGYVGSAGRKVRVGVVYNNAAMDFEDFRIDGDWYQHLATSCYRSFNGGVNWDSSKALGDLANTWQAFTLNPASVPDLETEVQLASLFYVGDTVGANGEVRFSRVHLGSVADVMDYIPGGVSYTVDDFWGSRSFVAESSVKLYQDADRKIAAQIKLGAWSYPALYLWVTGFRIPVY